jgi:hypothetical protein
VGAALALACFGACSLGLSGTAPPLDPVGEDATVDASGETGSGSCVTCAPATDAAAAHDAAHDAAKDAKADARAVDAKVDSEGGAADGSSPACDTCVAQQCPGAQAACAAGSDCQAYLTCLVLCSGRDASSCSTDCGNLHPAGQQASATLTLCTILCAAVCSSGSSGGGGDSGAGDAYSGD